jgi:UDP-N-acetyl-D-glucosamine dehydrogenase
MNIEEKLSSKEMKIGIIGLGYVGLPFAMTFTQKGFKVIGYDVSQEKVDMINKGENYIGDVDDKQLKDSVTNGLFFASTDEMALKETDAIFICVPTPITKNRVPDTAFMESASKVALNAMSPGKLVVLRSTTYPGTTEELTLPILESTGFKLDKDFYLAFSPERIDPGNTVWTSDNTPIVVGGVTEKSGDVAEMVLKTVMPKVFRVSNAKVAEMEKLLENIFRSVNIALINEFAQMCDRMGDVNIWEVVSAAATKPFGFMPFTPGPGIGGHCILVDPYYLSWRAKGFDFHSQFIELAAKTNEDMPHYVRDLIVRALSENGKAVNHSKILFLGVAFKKGVDDIRNSPAIRVMELMSDVGKPYIEFSDPYVKEISFNGTHLVNKDISSANIKEFDCVVITTGHDEFDYQFFADEANVIVDTRNSMKNYSVKGSYYILGGGK